MGRMKRYKPIFQEMSVDDLRQQIMYLYEKYKYKYTKLSKIVSVIAKELKVAENTVLQVLQFTEDNTNDKEAKYEKI